MPPLLIARSSWLAGWLTCVHLGAVPGLVWLPWPLGVLVSMVLLASWRTSMGLQARRTSPAAVVEAVPVMSGDDPRELWRLTTVSGDTEVLALRRPDCWASQWLVILRFDGSGRRRRGGRWVIIAADALPGEHFRQLRKWLRQRQLDLPA